MSQVGSEAVGDIGEVFKLLECTDAGLDEQEAARRLKIYGPNKPKQKGSHPILKLFSLMWRPLLLILKIATIIMMVRWSWPAIVSVFLVLQSLIIDFIGFYKRRIEPGEVDIIKTLMDSRKVASKVKCKRNGIWKTIKASALVPGDVIYFKANDIVPADCKLTKAMNVSVDECALTGEPDPQRKGLGAECLCGSTCTRGEAEGVVTATGANTFFGRAASLIEESIGETESGYLQKILTPICAFSLVSIGIIVIAEICFLFPTLNYFYSRGIQNILVLLFGGIPIFVPGVVLVTIGLGMRQLAKNHVLVARPSAIHDLAGVDVLLTDKTGTLTTNQLIVDRDAVKTYARFNAQEVIQLAAYTCKTEDQDAIDSCIIGALAESSQAREGITLLDFKPFDFITRRTEITYREESTGRIKRVTKGMTGIVIELCTRNKTNELEDKLMDDVEHFLSRGLRSLAVAHEDIDHDDYEGEGNGFELIGLIPIFDPPRADTKQAINDARALCVDVKMVTGDSLTIAKETGRSLGLGDNIYPAKVLEDGRAPGSNCKTLEETILDADGFSGVFSAHKQEIVERLRMMGHQVAVTGDSENDVPAMSKATIGVAVEGAMAAASLAANLMLTESGLTSLVQAIRDSRIVLQRLRGYVIYSCAVTTRNVVCFSVLAFVFNFDFPPIMVLIMTLINVGILVAFSVDRVLPSNKPDRWNIPEIFSYAVAYGVYSALSTIALVALIVKTTFFQDKFGVSLESSGILPINKGQLSMIVYLQASVISQALIFVTRSRGFSLLERPSWALVGAFCATQLASTIIASKVDWGFAGVEHISGDWIKVVWAWNIMWFLPLDFIKFAVNGIVRKDIQNRGLLHY